jgi:hypothetical protein
VRPEGLCQWRILVTPSEIEPATVRLVAQCLNKLRHNITVMSMKNSNDIIGNRSRELVAQWLNQLHHRVPQ